MSNLVCSNCGKEFEYKEGEPTTEDGQHDICDACTKDGLDEVWQEAALAKLEGDIGYVCQCGFYVSDKDRICPNCSKKERKREDQDEQKISMRLAEVLIPLYKKGVEVVDSCTNGERSEAMCNNCNIENCSRTKVFKFRQVVLKIQGESDRG